MKGYTTKETSTEHAPEVLEDKVLVYWNAEDGKWRISRTTVTRRTVETTERHESTAGFATFAEAVPAVEEHKLPVYVPSDDRHRAETELAEMAEDKADKAAVDAAKRARRAATALSQED